MVAQVLADAGQVMHHADAMLLQDVGVADSGELEKLR
jgi:hypothetical protein